MEPSFGSNNNRSISGGSLSMNRSIKPCSAVTRTSSPTTRLLDRLSTLPDELIIRILSLLPTKDAAATSVLSRRLMRVFPYIMSLDFHPSPIKLCLQHPYAIHRYPTFVDFVDTVLRRYTSDYLTKFRLKAGSDVIEIPYYGGCCSSFNTFSPGCLPDLNAERLHAWISFPLTFYSLRELDLSIMVRKPAGSQLPPAIFTCQTLEVLKLEVNIGLDQVITMPSYLLPNLRLLSLCVSVISDDDFLPRLVSSCPSLEDLTFEASTNHHVRHTTVSSTSLRRLSLRLEDRPDDLVRANTDVVLIDTPNLEYLHYSDNIAFQYSIPIMGCLAKAELQIIYLLQSEEDGHLAFQSIISLVRACSLVQHLSLLGYLVREFECDGEKALIDQLPLFPNLKHLELRCDFENFYWDKLMLPFLNCSPILETIVFIEGLVMYYEDGHMMFDKESLELERDFFRKNHAIPSCCRYHLKRIVIQVYYGLEREVEIIQFFLRHALVLEELVICLSQHPRFPIPDQISVENTLNNLPKASVACSIRVT